MNMVKPTHCTDLRLSTLNPPMLNRGVCARVCAEGTGDGRTRMDLLITLAPKIIGSTHHDLKIMVGRDSRRFAGNRVLLYETEMIEFMEHVLAFLKRPKPFALLEIAWASSPPLLRPSSPSCLAAAPPASAIPSTPCVGDLQLDGFKVYCSLTNPRGGPAKFSNGRTTF